MDALFHTGNRRAVKPNRLTGRGAPADFSESRTDGSAVTTEPGAAGGAQPGLGGRQPGKRLYDLVLALGGLAVLSPLFLVIAALIKLTDGGEIFYRQVRVGRGGRTFRIWKFRTMVRHADQIGPAVTKDGDPRVTRLGRILRKAKLDELPQLWNVVKGEMSLVGPRPEVPRYVEHYTAEQRAMLRYQPGITDLASLCFREEEALLGGAENPETFYVQQCLPRKLQLNREYAERANLLSDTWIILQTICPYWAGVLVCYGIILTLSFWLAYELIDNFAPLDFGSLPFRREWAVVLAVQLGCLTWRKQWTGLLSYFSFPELRQVGTALGLATLCLLAFSAAGRGQPPQNVLLVDTLVSLSMLSGFRVLLRLWRERSAVEDETPAGAPTRVGIIGAGGRGAQLALELIGNRRLGRMVVAFFDDDSHKWQKRIHDVPVVGMPECLLDGWTEKLDEVAVVMPGAPEDRLREIDRLLHQAHLKFYMVSFPSRFWDRQQAA